MSELLHFKPYARLLTMIGDQLIKNESVAIMELIKNAYDADASWCRVAFENIGKDGAVADNSKIIIEDDGCGMSAEVIKEAWMAPASPQKKRRGEKLRTPGKKRIVQGEKGIGRFALLKLGSKITVVTRTDGSSKEHILVLDFSNYRDEFTEKDGKPQKTLLADLTGELSTRTAKTIVPGLVPGVFPVLKRGTTGTRIVVENLRRQNWREETIQQIALETSYLQPIFSEVTGAKERKEDAFRIVMTRNGDEIGSQEKAISNLQVLLEEQSVLKIQRGRFDSKANVFFFSLNNRDEIMSFDRLRQYSPERFSVKKGHGHLYPECGSFTFEFFVFDLRVDKEDRKTSKYSLNDDDKELVKRHRIYLYRDGIRVYPYGNLDDDWLQIDVLRGTSQAAALLSNKQVVGWIGISHDGNPDLKDKTSREGLVAEGTAVEDFIETIQMFLKYIRQEPFAKYRLGVLKRREQRAIRDKKVDASVAALLRHADKTGDKTVALLAKSIQLGTDKERRISQTRIDMMEDLSAVGLSVEMASHDLMMMALRANESFDRLTTLSESGDKRCKECYSEIQKTRGELSFIEHRMKDIQSLFRSSKQRMHPINVKLVFDKIKKIYERAYRKAGIDLSVDGDMFPLTVKCTDAILMQTFINLLDNSLYWLTVNETSPTERKVRVYIDGTRKVFLFSDNGPGIPPENREFVFDAFFSTKDQGRGLGLYITRQLLNRCDFSIDFAAKKDQLLDGASFIIDFNPSEEEQ
jgi:signal transduction histidine kinase